MDLVNGDAVLACAATDVFGKGIGQENPVA
jgi:hypothetical protein